MKISYHWLKDYLAIDLPPEKVASLLTNCGLEVENMETFQSVKGGLEGLVIGEIKEITPHPNADHLRLAKVEINQGTPLSVVCGAPNIKTNQKVVVAPIGTTLYPASASPMQIKKAKIRGEESQGMICAEDEIGLGIDHSGVIVLKEDAKVGMSAAEYFNIITDTVFEIGLTPNRADAASHLGVARDLLAVLATTSFDYQELSVSLPSVADFKTDNHDLPMQVEVEDTEACPRYAGLTLSGIQVAPSPTWLQNRLKAIGLKPINNVVDITNYVLHETGQPLHAFDADKIHGNKVMVTQLPDKTKFTTLDGIERELSDTDLMICTESLHVKNKKEGMCIAGVFGGIQSGVSETTQNIFLESAYFNPVSIRKTAKRHGVNTDASFRFERGANPSMTVYALQRAAMLIKKVAGGKISSEVIDIYPLAMDDFVVPFSYRNCDRLIGKSIERATIKNILLHLGIRITKESEDDLLLSVPPFKVDVKREADVIEEILRIYNYNRVEITDTLKTSLSYSPYPDRDKIQNSIAGLLTHNGFNEILCNSLSNSKYYKETIDKCVKVLHPVSSELDVLRQSLLYGGLETLLHNQNRKMNDLKFFEFGKTYQMLPSPNPNHPLDKYKEKWRLSLLLMGRKQKEHWNTNEDKVSFAFIKGFVETILQQFGINNVKEEHTTQTMFDEGVTWKVKEKEQELVSFGSVNAKLLREMDVKQQVFYADFDWDALISLSKNHRVSYKEIPVYPSVRRDLALLLDKQVTYAEIRELAFDTEKKLLKQMNLFDVYEGDKLEKNKKSYAVSFILQDENKTLMDKQIDKTMNNLISVFQDKLNAIIRQR